MAYTILNYEVAAVRNQSSVGSENTKCIRVCMGTILDHHNRLRLSAKIADDRKTVAGIAGNKFDSLMFTNYARHSTMIKVHGNN